MGDTKVDALKRVPLFAHGSHRELEFLAGHADEADVPAGETLAQQGRSGDSFYVLIEGEAEVTVDGSPRRTLGPGDFFGEISMLDRGAATATVTTRTPARVMVMSHAQFRDAIKANPELLSQVLAAVADRLRADSVARLAGD